MDVVEINALLPTPEQKQTFLARPDLPVIMVNLLKFKPGGEAVACVIGNGDWDMIALVEYPSPAGFSQMVNSDEYQAIHYHREAGLEGQVLYASQWRKTCL